MLIEESKYINGYFGIMRDIHITKNEVKIVFNAFLNDDLNFTLFKNYSSEEKAKIVINEFIVRSEYLKDKLSYSAETVERINKSIHELIFDILNDNVDLPENGKGYQFMGDKVHLRGMNKKNIEFVCFD